MKYFKYIIYSVVAFLLHSCITKQEELTYPLTFHAVYSASAKNSSIIPQGLKAKLYTYKAENYASNVTPSSVLVSNGTGGMDAQHIICLPSGIYNIYSLSAGDFNEPSFSQSSDSTVIPENNKDYLWAAINNTFINGPTILSLLYKHISVKIEIAVITPTGFDYIEANSMKFTFPDTNFSEILIKEGTVTPASSLLPATEIPGSGCCRSFITIPCTNVAPSIELSLDISLEGSVMENVLYSATLDFPFIQGNFYKIEITPRDFTLSTVRVGRTDWNEQHSSVVYTKPQQ